jgi:hypothetical protein
LFSLKLLSVSESFFLVPDKRLQAIEEKGQIFGVILSGTVPMRVAVISFVLDSTIPWKDWCQCE